LVIHEGETLAEVKVRVQKKLQVPDEEFSKVFSSWCLLSYCHTLAQTCRVLSPCLLLNVISFFLPHFVVSFQWKFAFLSLGRPEYLQDSDIVSSRFQVRLTALSLSLSQHAHSGVIYIGMINGVLISACDLSFCREGMFMVLGSSILGWNTRTTHLKDRTQPIRYVIAL
jgi:hypothetical protein